MRRYTNEEIEHKAQAISRVYPGEKWARKVYNMSANQVAAIYDNFAKKGYFNGKRPKSKAQQKRDKEKKKQVPGQMSIFDYPIDNDPGCHITERRF